MHANNFGLQVKKRLETSIRNRRTTRFSVFDKIRNLPRCESPAPIPEVQKKVEHRRMQLEKWKEEKEKKKKEASLQKKKPFIAGVPHNPLKFVPPPPPKPMPSTSGRVTRSQSSKNNSVNNVKKPNKTEGKSKMIASSFAPKNAVFHPPVLKNMVNLPTLSVSKQIEKKAITNMAEKKNKESKSKILKDNSKQNESRVLRNRPQSDKGQGKTQVTKNKKADACKESTSSSSSSVESNYDEPNASKSLKSRTPRKSLQNKQNMVTPKNVPKSESSSEEKLRSPKLIEIPMTPEQIAEEAKKISPCVTLSRGKDNARREMKKKLEEGLLDEDLCEMDSVEHFRRQLDSEIARMTEMCEAWEKISHQIALPETVQEAVLSAVGQARLLMSQKLQQFASLLSRCEHPTPNSGLVTPSDLHGFWDMVFMQIENVDMRFRKLEELRSRGWSEDQPPPRVTRPVPRPSRPQPAARPAPAARPGNSRLKDLIAAARKAKQAKCSEEVSTEESKTIDMGFFCIQSPVKSPLQVTPSKPSLLKAVLSNEAEKSANRKSASFAMLRASLIGRQVESEGSSDEEHNLITFTPVDLGATPGRSILKNKPSTKKSAKKSIKVVLFNESDTELQNNSMSSDKALEAEDVETQEGQKLQTEHNTDSGISSMDIENDTEKENKGRRRSRLTRQDATEERSPVMTRSRRKSILTPGKEAAARKNNTLKEANLEHNTTTRRSTRKSIHDDH
ncbi:disks large-associated protein 5 isoform X2 [Danaus plexippus]|uniref:disks large-associated protein 5 isoform X2 n=1 Tax=Danaus plexippus TaxID=13037 RepID=UPI002AB04BEE|nr:disks large-associated protein 5 isoform X2 [Danaus plexippus]